MDYYYYHNEKIPTGISFTNANIESFKVLKRAIDHYKEDDKS